MPAGIVLAGGRSRRMGTPKAWLDWHGEPLLRRVVGLVARGAGGPVIVVRAPGQELPALPAGVRVVEDAREGRGPLQGLLAGLEAADGEVAFAASTDVPFLHPRFVAAVCRAVDGADAAVPFVDGFRQPLAAAYRTALVPLVAELVEAGRMKTGFLFERCETRWLEELPHPESVRNVNAPRGLPRGAGRAGAGRARALLRAAAAPGGRRRARRRSGAAASAVGVQLDAHVVAALNGDQIARDPLEPLAEGDEVAFMAADAGG